MILGHLESPPFIDSEGRKYSKKILLQPSVKIKRKKMQQALLGEETPSSSESCNYSSFYVSPLSLKKCCKIEREG